MRQKNFPELCRFTSTLTRKAQFFKNHHRALTKSSHFVLIATSLLHLFDQIPYPRNPHIENKRFPFHQKTHAHHVNFTFRDFRNTFFFEILA